MDYGFTHDGRVFTPNGTEGIAPSDNDARNKATEAGELERWTLQPGFHMGYYDGAKGTVTTWLGSVIGHITESNIYRHNFGGKFISIKVKGTNGASYYGRASYDWGSVIKLRKVK